jgi:hypothetical protein
MNCVAYHDECAGGVSPVEISESDTEAPLLNGLTQLEKFGDTVSVSQQFSLKKSRLTVDPNL